jgi:hypothetical protein
LPIRAETGNAAPFLSAFPQLLSGLSAPLPVTIWELILLWALGASVAVTVAMVVALAVIFWVSRKLG